MSEKLLLSRKDAAEMLRLSVRSLDYLLARGEFVAKKVGRRTLIVRGSLEQFCKSPRAARITTPSPADAERQA